jgi:hypothetical protein
LKKTVFVVGAGASTDFDLPLGSSLAEQIRQTLNAEFGTRTGGADGNVEQGLGVEGMRLEHVQAALDLRGALLRSGSIDHALYTLRGRPEIVQVGKVAIADQILQAERRSPLPKGACSERHIFHDNLNRCRRSWLARLLVALLGDRAPEDFSGAFDGVAFVTFNYDRCIEQYLFYALQDIGGLQTNVAAAIVSKIPIVHVYGYLGAPSFLRGNMHTDFGSDQPLAAGYTARSIKTFTEGAERGTLEDVHRLMAWAERAVLLGFGFDPLNVKALFPTGRVAGQEIMGTIYKADPDLLESFRAAIGAALPAGLRDASFIDRACSDFIDATARQLVR